MTTNKGFKSCKEFTLSFPLPTITYPVGPHLKSPYHHTRNLSTGSPTNSCQRVAIEEWPTAGGNPAMEPQNLHSPITHTYDTETQNSNSRAEKKSEGKALKLVSPKRQLRPS